MKERWPDGIIARCISSLVAGACRRVLPCPALTCCLGVPQAGRELLKDLDLGRVVLDSACADMQRICQAEATRDHQVGPCMVRIVAKGAR